eukprot:SAG31_NODE_1054_length_10140_cov_4.264316_1_plen_146_part_00
MEERPAEPADVLLLDEKMRATDRKRAPESDQPGEQRNNDEKKTRERLREPPKKRMVTLADGRVVSSNVRNHVNPLSQHYNKPIPAPIDSWSTIYADLSKPIVMDIGCAKGHFCLEGAKRFPKQNWLGAHRAESTLYDRYLLWICK